ncbi:MAG: Re/Si-specific NAD(P)(+) transhydrogenase subunit alpha [Gemmatimonadetes bacterium]|nr:Re/Si-specific NAD(P)(+) transhydrogenase subunit alpha [Gemmatimonadota bacterium]NIO31364.1 Re/Si-specific NAD(P)(+) transhydrogenase subunit alpha [Gemmatimonadota bacterium]
MKIGVPKEIIEGERRVALVPKEVAKLVEAGFEVQIEAGAGTGSFFGDTAYEEAGATIVDGPKAAYDADVVFKVRKPEPSEVGLLKAGSMLVGFLEPLTSPELMKQLAEAKVTAVALEAVPRISRAQKMDALSSQANIAGYKAALIAANSLPKFFPMSMTAAGMIPPAKALILGVGVAGLQAIATCRRLGASVEAYDIRPATKEEVQSLGAKFIEITLEEEELEDAGGYGKEVSEASAQRQKEVLAEHIKAADIVITTAAVPGKKAPVLVEEDAVKGMKEGSVIVDLAAETGGNCTLTEAGKTVVKHGVIIHGPADLVSEMPVDASSLFARNVAALFEEFVKDGELNMDFEDEVIAGSCITHNGEVVNERVKAQL